ncbi:hypothetical protein BH18ACI5_BH18ACI5_03780 [soil metagenome]
MSTNSRTDTTLYVSAALAAVLLAMGSVGWSVRSRHRPQTYATGDRFDEVPNLDLTASPSTLLIWVDSRCGACTASMPFYQRLAAHRYRMPIVVIGRQPAQVLEDYLATFGVRPAQVISVGDLPLKFRGTPTVVLVGKDSIVRSVWYGRRQTAMDEEDIIKRLE